MRRFLIIIIVVFFAGWMAACTNAGRTPKNNGSEKYSAAKDTLSEDYPVASLTTEMFKVKVMDYEKNSQWAFLGQRPAIVDFYATWCGPCKATAPVLESVAMAYQGKLDVYKVDIDQEPELAQVFGISSIPALLFIPVDDLPTLQVGAMQKPEMEKLIKSVLLHGK